MKFSFFKSSPLLDEDSIFWMFECFSWALKHLDADVFFRETTLVVPGDEHFPRKGTTAFETASLVFDRVMNFAGLQHWPFRLVDNNTLDGIEIPPITGFGVLRGAGGIVPIDASQQFLVPYDLELLREPEVLIATYAHTLSHYLGSCVQEEPPGGRENWPHVTELLSVYLGFGLIMSNTAFTQKIRSCGSCSGPSVERTNYLSQYDMTYALAIFCVAKQISTQDALRYLKKALRPFFKKAIKDVITHSEQLDELKRYRN